MSATFSRSSCKNGTDLDKATVDDVLYTIDGDTCFSDIGRKDDLSRIPRGGIEDQSLFLWWQTGV